MSITPYLFFEGRCEEAAEFYRDALGAEIVMMMRMSDSPVPHQPSGIAPGNDHKIMHMTLRIGLHELMLSDGMCSGEPKFSGFALSLPAADRAEAERTFAALTPGGRVLMPLGETFFAPSFGMVADRFGVTWMITVAV